MSSNRMPLLDGLTMPSKDHKESEQLQQIKQTMFDQGSLMATEEAESIDEASQHGAKIDAMEAFSKFKELGGTFYRQAERQIITMDNNGGLHYEQRNEFNNTMNT